MLLKKTCFIYILNKQRSYLKIDYITFKANFECISSLAYFVEHLHVFFEPSEICSDENNQKIIKAVEYLFANDTKHILKKVSFLQCIKK